MNEQRPQMSLRRSYSTEQVRRLLSWAEGCEKTKMDVANKMRVGKPFRIARVGPGQFDPKRIDAIIDAIARRRLLRDLGRISERLPDLDYALECPEPGCGVLAVHWEGRRKCLNDHEGEYTP